LFGKKIASSIKSHQLDNRAGAGKKDGILDLGFRAVKYTGPIGNSGHLWRRSALRRIALLSHLAGRRALRKVALGREDCSTNGWMMQATMVLREVAIGTQLSFDITQSAQGITSRKRVQALQQCTVHHVSGRCFSACLIFLDK
jgi:hypothetical protein